MDSVDSRNVMDIVDSREMPWTLWIPQKYQGHCEIQMNVIGIVDFREMSRALRTLVGQYEQCGFLRNALYILDAEMHCFHNGSLKYQLSKLAFRVLVNYHVTVDLKELHGYRMLGVRILQICIDLHCEV